MSSTSTPPADGHDHGHDHAPDPTVVPVVVGAPAPVVVVAADDPGHDHGHDHAPHVEPPRELNLVTCGTVSALVAVFGVGSVLCCLGSIDEHFDRQAALNYPINTAEPGNVVGRRSNANMQGGACSPDEQRELDYAIYLRDKLVVKPVVRAALDNKTARLDPTHPNLCLTNKDAFAVLPDNSASVWLTGTDTFNYGDAFFKDPTSDCVRAATIVAMEACMASVGDKTCANDNGKIAIAKDRSKLPPAIQNVWNVSYKACR